LSNQVCKSSISACSILTWVSFKICLNNFASFAYTNNSAPLVQRSAKSLIKIINNNGPRVEPCGILLSICCQCEKKPLGLTRNLSSV